MRGIVEIYKNYGTPQQELVEESHNLIVDGAGEMICDLMTLPVEGSAISSASAIYDSSNFTVRAVSFGKAASGYLYNAHGADAFASNSISNGRIGALTNSSITVSSHVPFLFLPDDPDPLDYKLAYIPSGQFNSIAGSGLSSLEVFGQNLNLYAYGTTLAGGGLVRNWIRVGAWPRGSTGASAELGYINNAGNAVVIASATGVLSNFNNVSSMDWRGFVTTTSSTNPLSGLVTSSTNSFSSTGEIIYQITVSGSDALFANHYGGITQMGLWGLNLKSMLAAGRTPPYAFHPYINVLDYRLFSKKTFNKNIVAIQDNGSDAGLRNYSNLTIIWRIFFL
jgi:hypothetical protein